MARLGSRLPRRGPPHAHPEEEPEPGPLEPGSLSALLVTPRWLRDLGVSAWLTVGIALAVVGLVTLLSLTHTIVAPLLAASVIAAVASPLLSWLERHHVPRGLGAALLLVAAIALAAGMVLLILAGITSQSDALSGHLDEAKTTLAGWAHDLGVSTASAQDAKDQASKAVGDAVPQLLNGIVGGLKTLSSLVFFLSLTMLSLFFLLKDGPQIRAWFEGHMRVPPAVAHRMNGRVLESLRGYFVGVTAVAIFNATLVLLGALVLGVPLAGTIAVVTFMGAYIPYLGAWSAGAFSVLVALGGAGTDAAIGMIVIQLLANGILQQMIQPIAYGAALGIHPLAVLVVTIAGGALFGAVGLILAAPLTSALTKIANDLSLAAPQPSASAADGVPVPDAMAMP
jgi:predicted PurR-regulated permease PerM